MRDEADFNLSETIKETYQAANKKEWYKEWMHYYEWNKKEHAHYHRNYPNGWCIIEGVSACGEHEFQVSDGIERSTSYDYYDFVEAIKECIRLNKEEPLEEIN